MVKVLTAFMAALLLAAAGACSNGSDGDEARAVATTSTVAETSTTTRDDAWEAAFAEVGLSVPPEPIKNAVYTLCSATTEELSRAMQGTTADNAEVYTAGFSVACPDKLGGLKAALTATTTTRAPAPPPPPPTTEPMLPTEVFSGTGDSVVRIATPGMRAAKISHRGSRNFVVRSIDDSMESTDLLVNEIGNYDGVVPVDFDGSVSTGFEVTADGPWRIEIGDPDLLRMADGPFNGRGDDIVTYMGGVGPATIQHSGSRNFVVLTTFKGDRDLLVNEIGNYSGTVVLRGPTYVIVSADGEWSVTPG